MAAPCSVDSYIRLAIDTCVYREGLHAGWRGLLSAPVAFAFGHGLAYTEFAYAWHARPLVGAANVSLAVTVTNTGDAPSKEVVQLYLSFPRSAREPALLLRGFEKTATLPPGGTQTVAFELPLASALSIWEGRVDDATGRWATVAGTFTATVGRSSRDHRLTASFEVGIDVE